MIELETPVEAAQWRELGERLDARKKATPGVIYFIQCGDFPVRMTEQYIRNRRGEKVKPTK